MGMWTIPSVSASIDPQGTRGGWDSSSWVGLDGTYGSDDVLQAGIEQRVTISGVAEYVAWYEWFAPPIPGSPPYVYQVNIPDFPVSPDQTVFCAVGYVSNHTAGNIYFANFTTGRYFGITLAPPPNATFSGNTAEWILEAPDNGIPITSLPTWNRPGPHTPPGKPCCTPTCAPATSCSPVSTSWSSTGPTPAAAPDTSTLSCSSPASPGAPPPDHARSVGSRAKAPAQANLGGRQYVLSSADGPSGAVAQCPGGRAWRRVIVFPGPVVSAGCAFRYRSGSRNRW